MKTTKFLWVKVGVWMLAGLMAACNGNGKQTCEADSCSGHGSCDDSSGKIVCTCEAGFGGDRCETCAAGYQDNDQDGSCQPGCAHQTLGCGVGGDCDDSSGAVSCVCHAGYVGDLCESCDSGYQDNDGDGSCLPTCAVMELDCGPHGHCDDSGGVAQCACDTGYTGDSCMRCAADYQDNDGDGVCEPGCSNPEFNCGGHGDCDDSSGSVSCVCEEGYTGDLCNLCAAGYQDNDLDGACLPDCQTAGLDCPTHASCSDLSGTATCVCDTGYTGAGCDQCIAGYQDNDQNGTCLPDCATAGYACSGQGVCSDANGVAHCECNPGFFPDGQGNCVESGTGEDCSSAKLLAITGDTVTEHGTTVGTGDNAQPSCVDDDSQDMVYYFNLAQDIHARFHVTGYDTVMYLRTVCEDPQTEIACNDDIVSGQVRDSLIERDLEAGSYYLFIDGWGAETGDFTLEVEFSCAKGQILDPATGLCVDDPCDPNPCTEPNKNTCLPVLPDSYTCQCNVGYIPDGSGGCMQDPNANEWAWLVFLNADNNLESDGYDDLGEMMQAGSTAYVHIVTLMDSYSQDGGDARKLYVKQGEVEVIENLGEVDMGDWQILADFGSWAVQNYPARHYALILWNHGSGWDKGPPEASLLTKGFSNDDHGSGAGISVANGDYGRALQAITQALGGKLDIVGFDACLMGMWEVAEATAPYAHYLLASEETEPGWGWPYADFLVPLVNDWQTTPVDLACNVVSAYYDDSFSNATLSVVDLASMDTLTGAMTGFADALMSHPDLYEEFGNIRRQTTGFDFPTHKDLYDFAQGVANMSAGPQDLVGAANTLMTEIDTAVVCSESHMSDAFGMAVYFPSLNVDSAYQNGVWAGRSTWDEFLDDFCAW
jgi:hypothetical protein